MTFSSNQQPASTAYSGSRRQLLRLCAAGAVASLAAGCTLPGAAQSADREAQAWAAANIPDQTGRRVLITGGNGYPREGRSGLGYQAALALVRKGADVTIASRDATKGAEAVRLIRGEVPGARIRFDALDLTDLAQVKAYAMRWRGSGERLDLLINNAGVMGRRARETTRAGHERVFATNVMGPFVLTAGLMPVLREEAHPGSPGSPAAGSAPFRWTICSSSRTMITRRPTTAPSWGCSWWRRSCSVAVRPRDGASPAWRVTPE